MTVPFALDDETRLAWIAIAHSARIDQHAMQLIGDPQPGSNFAKAAVLYPFEKVSDRVRAYLAAGVEHLLMWADHNVPLKFHEDMVVHVALRPTYTLARATIEAAAQAVWLMDTRDPLECIRRHLSLMRWDLHEHRKSKLDQAGKDAVIAREQALLAGVAGVFQPDQIRPPNGYLDVIRSACAATSLALDPSEAERLWRAASGAAHGKYWPTLDLQETFVGEEYEPGHRRAMQVPDAVMMTQMLRAADVMSGYGVLLYAQYSGADVAAVLGKATAFVADEIPLLPGVERGDLHRMRRALP